jgi:hypothetical protein
VQPHFRGLSNLFDIVLKLAVLLFGEFVESLNTVGTFLQKKIKAFVNKIFFTDFYSMKCRAKTFSWSQRVPSHELEVLKLFLLGKSFARYGRGAFMRKTITM